MMHRCVANLLLGIILILVDGTQGAHRLAGDHLPDCDENVSRTCTWHSQQALPEPVIIHGAWRSALGVFPVLIMDGVADNTQQTLPAVKGFTLSLRRLVLGNVTLAPPDAVGVPALWPQHMYTAPAAALELEDVRIVVSAEDFQAYLTFLQSNSSKATYFTDGVGFLHISLWDFGPTSVHSVTLVSGPCTPPMAAMYSDPTVLLSTAVAASNGSCAISAGANNHTLIPALLREASIPTSQPLLVLLAANVSLGAGLTHGAILVCRPVILVGLYTRRTSVDFGMVINQLNATDPLAKLWWQSLELENLAPGDGLSATIAPPYSVSISCNVWAIYCPRTRDCCNLINTTTVVATAAERDYLTFMYTMYNSPLPSMQKTTNFYHTDLKVTTLQFTPGPGDDDITCQAVKSISWDWTNNIITAEPRVARKMPLPAGLQLPISQTQAGALVQAVDSCSTFQDAVLYPGEHNISITRPIVWMLTANITLNPPEQLKCWEPHMVAYSIKMSGEDFQGNNTGGDPSEQSVLRQELLPKPDSASAETSAETVPNPTPLTQVYAVGFNYMLRALMLPATAPDKQFEIENVMLHQLPQGPNIGAVQADSGWSGAVAPDVWTVLLWSIERDMAGSSLTLSHVELVVPKPEFDFLQAKAQAALSFAVQLAGGSTILVTGAAASDSAVRLGTMQAPGLIGNMVWIVAEPADAAAARPDYIWRQAFSGVPGPAPAAGGAALSAGQRAAIGSSVGAVAVLAVLAFGLWCGWRRRQRQRQPASKIVGDAAGSDVSIFMHGSGSGDASAKKYNVVHLQLPRASQDIQLDMDQVTQRSSLYKTAALSMNLSHDKLAAKAAKDTAAAATGTAAETEGAAGMPLAGAPQTPGETDSSESALAPAAAVGGLGTGGSADTVQTGLDRWRQAISSTIMTLMERKMNAGSGFTRSCPSRLSSMSRLMIATPELPDRGDVITSPAGGRVHAVRPLGAARQPGLGPAAGDVQLQHIIGQGSFGRVYLAAWHGKRVAVKVMQLPADVLLNDSPSATSQMRQHNSTPHMAIMETVVSSTTSHPNIVQVYTYTLNPLTVDKGPGAGDGHAGSPTNGNGFGSGSSLLGWELRLVMEFCDQGTLRDALSHKTLLRGNRSPYLPPCIVLSLAHDVAAAMLHLHSEGVVHGDLKAANVLLSKSGDDRGSAWTATIGYRVIAKVADFGLAMPLGPNDTHATMPARGTPTHMSPELFISGHLSKASDVYAYGILLFEIIAGERAYAGVPVALLPHEVARQGLRPRWPPNLSPAYKHLQRLAEACWAQEPQDRPIFADVFEYLESCQNGVPARELLHRGNSSNPVSSSTLMSSPTAAQAVDQQLYGLKLSADMQLRQMQAQTEKGMAVDQGVPGVAAVMNGADIAWSEVTYGGVPETHLVQPLQDMQQQLGLRLQQQPQQQEWLQDQQLQQAPQQLRQEHAPALRLID